MEMKELEVQLIQVIANKLNLQEDAITGESRFQEDLGADSLDLVELIMEIEERFGVTINEDESDKLRTVADAVAIIASRIKDK